MTDAVGNPHEQAARAWAAKPILRLVYGDMHAMIAARVTGERVLEVGGGAGFFRLEGKLHVSIDLTESEFSDVVGNAEFMPFCDGSFDSLVMIDVLHHIQHPAAFFDEARRVLRPGGRLVIVDPAITPGSYLFYHLLHVEPVRMGIDPLSGDALSGDDPYDSNQAVATRIFGRDSSAFRARWPDLRVLERRWFAWLAYPLSGGLQSWSLITPLIGKWLLGFERRLPQWLMRVVAFRMIVVCERA